MTSKKIAAKKSKKRAKTKVKEALPKKRSSKVVATPKRKHTPRQFFVVDRGAVAFPQYIAFETMGEADDYATDGEDIIGPAIVAERRRNE